MARDFASLTVEDMLTIEAESINKQRPTIFTKDAEEFRDLMDKQVAAIKRRKLLVLVPGEWPS